jgi:hypothetical protein
MTTDFKATQVQTNKIIVTGSFANDGSNQLLIYNYAADDSGTPNQGVIDPTKFDTTSGIGSDVFLFVSGGVSTRGTGESYGVTVMGGDLHVSGNLTVDGTYPSGGGGGGGNDYWKSTQNKLIFNTGSIRQGTAVTIDLPTTNSIIFSSQGSARLYGGLSNAIISSDSSKLRNTTGLASDVRSNTIISDVTSEIDSDGVSGFGTTGWNVIAASAFNRIESGSQANIILGSAGVNIVSGSFVNGTLAAGDVQNTFALPVVLDNAAGSAIIAGGPNIISSSDGISVINSAIIGSNWTINSSRTYAIGDTVNAAQVLISASNGMEITGQTKFFSGLSGSLTQLTDGTSYLIAGSGISISSSSNGPVTVSTSGSFGLATGKQYVAPYTTTTSTTPVVAGQFSWVPADYTGLASVTVRAIMSTDGTANHTGSLQLYNLTSGNYVSIIDTPAVSNFFEITSSIPTLVTSSNLLTGITNFDNSSTSVYEVRVSGSLASSTFVGGVELVFG